MRYVEESAAREMFDDMLDEVYAGFMGLLPSAILKATDPIAYRVGFSDYLDAEGITYDEDEADEEQD